VLLSGGEAKGCLGIGRRNAALSPKEAGSATAARLPASRCGKLQHEHVMCVTCSKRQSGGMQPAACRAVTCEEAEEAQQQQLSIGPACPAQRPQCSALPSPRVRRPLPASGARAELVAPLRLPCPALAMLDGEQRRRRHSPMCTAGLESRAGCPATTGSSFSLSLHHHPLLSVVSIASRSPVSSCSLLLTRPPHLTAHAPLSTVSSLSHSHSHSPLNAQQQPS
jgi:hypothetical protein